MNLTNFLKKILNYSENFYPLIFENYYIYYNGVFISSYLNGNDIILKYKDKIDVYEYDDDINNVFELKKYRAMIVSKIC